MKTIFTFFLMLSAFSFLNAQSIQLINGVDHIKTYPNDTTITYNVIKGSGEVVFDLEVKNVSANAQKVNVFRRDIAVGGNLPFFCFGSACYETTTMEGELTTVAPNEFFTFSAHFPPNEVGNFSNRYTFYSIVSDDKGVEGIDTIMIKLEYKVAASSIGVFDTDNNQLANGQPITFTLNKDLNEVSAPLRVKNLTDETKSVLVKKRVTTNPQNLTNHFLWNSSPSANDDVVSELETLNAQSTHNFSAILNPNGVQNNVQIRYTFYVGSLNSPDSAMVKVNFDLALGIATVLTDELSVYNLDADFIQVSLPSNSQAVQAKLLDINGRAVLETDFNNEDFTLSTSQLSSGLYFYQLNNRQSQTLKSGKILVK